MARDLLGIPATSTPSERLFSKAGEVYSKYRKHMAGNTAQALLHTRTWWSVGTLPGANVPILKHPHIAQIRRNYPYLPVAVPCENGGWIVKVKDEREGDDNEKKLEEKDVDMELEKAGIHEDDLHDDMEESD